MVVMDDYVQTKVQNDFGKIDGKKAKLLLVVVDILSAEFIEMDVEYHEVAHVLPLREFKSGIGPAVQAVGRVLPYRGREYTTGMNTYVENTKADIINIVIVTHRRLVGALLSRYATLPNVSSVTRA